jgi:ATP-dependent Clp protease ATP-binding subunit ClpX
VGLDQIVQRRVGKRVLGYGASPEALHLTPEEMMRTLAPEDLFKFGMIPEFIGRLPVVATLEELDEAALVRVLTEPRNALIKQYEKLMSFEKVKLKFTDGAIAAVARKAFLQKTGARGLRSILEEVMLDLMYEVPSQKQIKEVLINEDVIIGKSQPIRIYEQDMKSA